MEPISAWSVNPDETYCLLPAAVTINSGPIVGAVTCDDDDSSTIYFDLPLGANFTGSTITVGIRAVATATSDDYDGDLDADVSAFCENDSGAVGADWGTEVPLDVTFSTQNDIEIAVSAAITPTATCQAGSQVFVRYQVDAAGTDGTITSQILGFLFGHDLADLDEVD
jgi:hypothetical protein